jgi:hypothetical protein
MEIRINLMKKNMHRFRINYVNIQYQYHDDGSVHDCKEDQEVLHHNVIHLCQDLFSNKTKNQINSNQFNSLTSQ